ncbi:phosphotransferase enzyme family protein [Actinacidiphila glaucinigra]|uniref:phosphotransferase enzyme family protein n=1 Tax=Actinacidiphila glaucinigra TaxID=235986 RepID=UPI00366BC516
MDREKAAEHAEVFEHFGIPEQDRPEESCYDYAPVFRTTVAGTPSAVKRTRNLPAAAAIGRWTRAMADSGIGVVTPLDLPGNPALVGERVWVAYPWISGRPYDGSVADIAAAGALLGRMHAYAYERDPELPSFEWPEHDDADVEAEIEDLRRVLTLRAPDIAEAVLARSAPWHRSFMAETLPAIRDGELPHVAASTDFKANNLVYTDNGPVLVDPDNADYLPRIIDLAMAALLFHNELPSAPPRLFTPAEWQVFTDEYLARVSLSAAEIELWPTALRYLITEWGTWTLVDADEWDDWSNPHKRAFLRDLATIEPDALSIVRIPLMDR